MQTTYPHTAARHRAKPFISSEEITWGITLLLAYLGLPALQQLLAWVLMKLYEMFVMYIY